MSALAFLFTCEHGGNAIPAPYAPLFAPWQDLLASHRGFDPGALETARVLTRAAGAPLFAATTSRLLVDLNRSIGHPGLFSEITRALPKATREAILSGYYHPHREAVAMAVAERLAAGDTVLHIACHSFTPVLAGQVRRCDVGFLYDPKRAEEKKFCLAWMRTLAACGMKLLLRRNFPYRGAADGLVTAFRRRFGERYLGVELEVNQRFVLESPQALAAMNGHLAEALLRTRDREASWR